MKDGDLPGGRRRQEQEDAAERANPSALVLHEAIRKEGNEELARHPASLAWSGLAAGFSMGLSLAVEGLLRTGLPDAPWRSLVENLGYSIGFLVVVLGRQQLFTENTLTVVLPLLHEPTREKLSRVAMLWGVVLVTNLLGTILFAWATQETGAFSDEAKRAFAEIGHEAQAGSFLAVFTKAVLAGWIIALMVWITPAVGATRFHVVATLTYVIGVAGFAHVIAGSTEVASAVFAGRVTWSDYIQAFLVPALLGNVLGGVVLTALLNHAQVRRQL
ncbi:formate/nitrite transporter family protein [Indioceanicola profundi]|uniref:formate/nitrite transporter family protein n=1 Tax=Indioceanicola profundi TaxID=2220096 RepID=UPI000E6AA072|nr:formate/nitrite transporter family protein [Indioceanicola profundi]